VTEGHNFKGSRRQLDSEREETRARAGGSYVLRDGRLRLGVEGSFARRVREETRQSGSTDVTSRVVCLHTGAEFFVTDAIALRGGWIRIARDDDLDAPRTLVVGNAWTVGGGYLPRGGLVQLDVSLRIQDLNPDYDGNPSLEESEIDLSMTARFLL
jgi:hypothetical protein